MGYRYYAQVTFPSKALAIPVIRQAFYQQRGLNCEEDGRTATISDDQANFGEIDFTEVLDRYEVPYDHYHRDDIELSEWTDHVWFENGERRVVASSETDSVQASFARELLAIAKQGDLNAVIQRLEETLADDPVTVQDRSVDWEPDATVVARVQEEDGEED